MDLTYPAEAEEFRTEIRGWLEENLPDGWFDEDFELSPEDKKAFNEAWPQKLFAGGWIASWPKEYGGKGLSTMQNMVLAEEFARAKAPLRADFFGDTLVRAHHPPARHRGAEEALPARHHEGRDGLVPGLLRARLGLGPRPPSRPPRCSTATSGSSTARRCGPPRPSSPTTASCSPAPTPTSRSRPASPTCWCR
ncbi:MAG: acyl-CoA dehydrogenase family protein [Acidimicrobiales bacterium]